MKGEIPKERQITVPGRNTEKGRLTVASLELDQGILGLHWRGFGGFHSLRISLREDSYIEDGGVFVSQGRSAFKAKFSLTEFEDIP
jgi:hypothetical protein